MYNKENITDNNINKRPKIKHNQKYFNDNKENIAMLNKVNSTYQFGEDGNSEDQDNMDCSLNCKSFKRDSYESIKPIPSNIKKTTAKVPINKDSYRTIGGYFCIKNTKRVINARPEPIISPKYLLNVESKIKKLINCDKKQNGSQRNIKEGTLNTFDCNKEQRIKNKTNSILRSEEHTSELQSLRRI